MIEPPRTMAVESIEHLRIARTHNIFIYVDGVQIADVQAYDIGKRWVRRAKRKDGRLVVNKMYGYVVTEYVRGSVTVDLQPR